MAQLRIAAAARAAGKDRGTLNRYIKSGKLSTTKDASGCIVIETAELLRVFGELKGDGGNAATDAAAPAAANSSVQHVLEATLELLKQQLHAAQDRETKLLDMLEWEQQTRRELEQRLLPPAPEAAPPASDDNEEIIFEAEVETIPTEQSAPQKTEETKKSFIARLFGV